MVLAERYEGGGQNVELNSGTSISASSPAVTSTGNWYVQVQTVGGTSTNTGLFNYSAQVPLVISLSPSSGGPSTKPTAVTSITITGSNFLAGSTQSDVRFVLPDELLERPEGPCGTSIACSNAIRHQFLDSDGHHPDRDEG